MQEVKAYPVNTIGVSAQEALKVFHTFDDQEPDLIPTGLPPIDQALGGLFPGTSLVVAGKTGVGKSSTMLAQAMQAAKNPKAKPGIVSLEDGPDVLGSRALSMLSGVDSLKIRTKRLSPDEKRRLQEAERNLSRIPLKVCYPIGGGIKGAVAAVERLGQEGCRLIFVDYLQKIRDGKEDRRNEVGYAFTMLQQAAAQSNAACVFISQVSRPQDATKQLTIHSLKESGDIENEARLIVLLDRPVGARVIRARLEKSTFGAEGLTFSMERDRSGMLTFAVDREAEEF